MSFPWGEDAVTIERGAELSPCGRYRYSLTRRWGPSPAGACFVMLNPSTADGVDDDPTVRRCIGFARSWGLDALEVVNLFAWRATDPEALGGVRDPIGEGNTVRIVQAALRASASASGVVVAAWGSRPWWPFVTERIAIVREALRPLRVKALGINADGNPRHPLYVRSDAPLVDFPPPATEAP